MVGAEGITVGAAEVAVQRSVDRGRTLYLNLTPMPYGHFPTRSGKTGAAWREIVGAALLDAGLRPRVEVYRGADREPWMESLLWRKVNRYCLALLKNPSDVGNPMGVIDQAPFDVSVKLGLPARGVRNVRTGKVFGDLSVFTDSFTPWEANLYEFGVGS